MNSFMAQIDRRRFFILLGALTFIGFGLRLWAGLEMRDVSAAAAPLSTTDMATYRTLAQSILEGEFPERFYYQPFYYSVFLPLVFFCFGTSASALIIVQSMLGAATIWFTGLIGGRSFGHLAGLAAAALLAVSRMHIFYTPFALLAVLQSFWIILLLYNLVLMLSFPLKRRYWIISGVVCGLAILTRGNVWFLVPPVLMPGVWRLRRMPSKAIVFAAVFIFLCYLPQLPFAIHNYRAVGRWTGPSTAADAVLALGNSPESPPGGLVYPPTYSHWMQNAQLEGNARVSVLNRIYDWFRREPLAYIELKARKFILFWNHLEIPNNVALAREGRFSFLMQIPLLAGFGLIGSVGLAGLIYGLFYRHPKNLKCLAIYGFAVMYCASTVAFYILARFRLPIVPVLCICGGGFLADMLRASHKRLIGGAVVMLLAAVFVGSGFQLYQSRLEKTLIRLVRPNGVVADMDTEILIYDHGPQILGGWEPMPWLHDDMRMGKQFNIPEKYAGGLWAIREFRMPLLQPAAGHLIVEVELPDGRLISQIVEIEPEQQGLVWTKINIPKEYRPRINEQLIEVKVRLRRETGDADLMTIVDTQREYGRTVVLLPPDQRRFIAPSELVLEMWLERL